MKTIHTAVAAVVVAGAIVVSSLPAAGNVGETKGPFQFEPLLASAPCTTGGNASQPFLVPEGFGQRIVASEPDFPDLPLRIPQETPSRTASQNGKILSARGSAHRQRPIFGLQQKEQGGPGSKS